ncbi:MAG: transcription-repair coupling factor [Kiritimatiellia bacterium]
MNAALEFFASRFTPPGGFPNGAVSLCLPALTGSADAFLAVTLAAAGNAGGARLVLVVTPGIPEAERLADDLRLLGAARILEFPPKLDGDRAALGLRLKTMAAIKAWSINPAPCIVVAAYPALSTPLPVGTDPIFVGTDPKKTSFPGGKTSFSSILALLTQLGYERLPQVEKEGDCSVRGGIVDFWSPGDEFPVRAEFFGDDLESLRRFNPASQTSIEKIDACELLPITAAALPSPEGDEPEDARAAPLPNETKGKTIFDLLPKGATILALDHNAYSLASWLPQPTTGQSSPPILYTGDPAPAGVPTYDFQTVPLPGFAELGADEAHHPELFDAARQRLQQHLDASERRGARVVRLDELSGGFELPGLVVVTKADRVFAKAKVRGRKPATGGGGIGARLSDFDDLEPGEYVVHLDYGVGRYLGSSEIVMDGRRSEVFTIEYADGGKLHVPAAHAHLLSRYVGVKGEAVHLHRLDGKRWEKDKRDAQKAVSDLAASLLETQARRETVPGFAYDVACDGLDAFEAAFPYEETPDQAAAIAAVKQDLAARRPMDRLICGDAGYGKTEVAMRAAFIAAMNGKQVAVLAPTTVLAEQHFETFTARFDGTPIRIESCSRFQTTGTHAGTFQRLATGACDIVIGTHAILSSKVCFRDLGLIVIDEEQRFGVRHKEFLKRLRATADVLTLSATPIPRTLYLSMTGARDLSLLRSPPRERVAVDTRIVRDSDETIRAAVENELARGGQVFFLHNRVMDIGKVEKRLHEIFAPAKPGSRAGVGERNGATPAQPRIVVAHGQMDARTLAKKMRDFERGDYDILLSTTIIESGIDIPRANTILVDRADTFGMADLYQLRGRVGRSSRQGHAYFLLPPSGSVDAEARERLTALRRHGGLGAGFNLAVRDLELRGAGNLLGSQQSGHIAAVGFGLYCQLLKRTIAMLKGEKVKAVVDVKLNLDFANPRLPYEYIEEDVQRLSLMKRFAEAQDVRVVKALAAEMRDRFGPLPPEAMEFVHIAELRVLCANALIERIDARDARAVFYRNGAPEVFKVIDLKGKSAERKIAELAKAIRG